MKKNIQFWLAFAVCIFGCGLLTASLIIRPTGTIDSTVLTAFGEIETVALTLFGIERFATHSPNHNAS